MYSQARVHPSSQTRRRSASEYKFKRKRILRDILIICFSILIAVYIQASFLSDLLVRFFSSFYFIPSAFIMGFLFSVTFTTAISSSVFILLSQATHNPLLVAVIGGLGSIAANAIVYKFFKEEIIDDIKFIEKKYARNIAYKILHSKVVIGLTPYLGALLLASPLPDELGILILAGTKFKYSHFLLLSFLLHTGGIFMIIEFSRLFL